jgi:hypothetical protein
MQKRDHETPEATRSAAEIEFVLRHAGRKTGPAMLRDLARAVTEPKPAPEKPRRAAARPGKTIV